MKDKLKVKGIKREKNRVYLTLLGSDMQKVRKLFRGFRCEVIDSNTVAICCSKKNEGRLTRILNEKIGFVKELESRFKQYYLISTVDELEIYPEVQEVESIAAPIENALTRFGDTFQWYTGASRKSRKIRPCEFTKKFRNFAKNKNADSFYIKGDQINLGFRKGRFVLSGQGITPARKFFMKNG
jgi:hypothetical protein